MIDKQSIIIRGEVEMMKRITVGLMIIMGIGLFSLTGYGAKMNKMEIARSLYENFYIGEAFASGFIYIEPFKIDREIGREEEPRFSRYPKKILFYPCYKDSGIKFYDASFHSIFKTYVPNIEKDSRYFSQPCSVPKQFGLRYKTKLSKRTQLGISINHFIISKIDYKVKGKKRPYSPKEFKRAQNEIAADREIEESDRTTDYMALENTIIGAKQILKIYLDGTPLTIRLSNYFTHGFEYGADVYVLDILEGEKVIRTYEKHNWDGPF